MAMQNSAIDKKGRSREDIRMRKSQQYIPKMIIIIKKGASHAFRLSMYG